MTAKGMVETREIIGIRHKGKRIQDAVLDYVDSIHRTIGAVNAETVKRYILEGQRKHWVEEEKKEQKTLFNFSG